MLQKLRRRGPLLRVARERRLHLVFAAKREDTTKLFRMGKPRQPLTAEETGKPSTQPRTEMNLVASIEMRLLDGLRGANGPIATLRILCSTRSADDPLNKEEP